MRTITDDNNGVLSWGGVRGTGIFLVNSLISPKIDNSQLISNRRLDLTVAVGASSINEKKNHPMVPAGFPAASSEHIDIEGMPR